jgi:hypothetical protein
MNRAIIFSVSWLKWTLGHLRDSLRSKPKAHENEDTNSSLERRPATVPPTQLARHYGVRRREIDVSDNDLQPARSALNQGLFLTNAGASPVEDTVLGRELTALNALFYDSHLHSHCRSTARYILLTYPDSTILRRYCFQQSHRAFLSCLLTSFWPPSPCCVVEVGGGGGGGGD